MGISEKIKNARLSCNMTQTEAAKRLGITNTTLSNWENAVSRPDVDMLKSICDLYEINPNYLYDWGIETIAAHKNERPADEDREEWSKKEREEIERFKEWVKSKRGE